MPKGRLVFDGDNVYTQKDARIYKLKSSVSSKIDAIPWVVNSLDSTSETDALSAKMWKELQDQITELAWVWTFLSTWDCTTGLPNTNPQEDPYTYKAWNYYIVADVASWGGTNYKPHWATYTQWVASTAVETDAVSVNDWYLYDWANWVRQPAWARQITIDSALSTASTNAVENRVVTTALNWKQNTISDLSDIRSWAAAWATALQRLDNITELTNNAGYQTAGDVTNIVNNVISTVAPDWVWAWILTLQKNATTVDTFSANATQNKTINITVPTTVAELTDASDYAKKTDVSSDLADYTPTANLWAAALSNDYNDLNNKPTIPTVNNATLTIQKNSTNVATFTANSNTPTVANISVPTTVAELSDANNYATKAYADNAAHAWATAPSPATEWMLWYDTTNDVLKTYDWTNWDATGKEYTAWEWIAILNWDDYSAMRGPCPEGFHIPLYSELNELIETLSTHFGLSLSGTEMWDYLKMPFSGKRWGDDWNISWVSTEWNYWTCSRNPAFTPYYFYSLKINSTEARFYSGWPNSWFSIRPFKDEPVVPDNSWTRIYYPDVLVWGEWIYWNSSLWLITIVYRKNAQTQYMTIADKNLWATVVYNTWDTLTANNCGGYFQWWNCYMFSFAWTETAERVTVDITGYWPWNYYYGNTFAIYYIWFTGNSQAATVRAYNLRWWETWVAQLNNAITNIAVSDAAFSSSWDWDTTHAPSKNAVYDVLGDVETLLANL